MTQTRTTQLQTLMPGQRWQGTRPWRNEVAVAVAMDVNRARTRAGVVLAVARAVVVARVVVVADNADNAAAVQTTTTTQPQMMPPQCR